MYRLARGKDPITGDEKEAFVDLLEESWRKRKKGRGSFLF